MKKGSKSAMIQTMKARAEFLCCLWEVFAKKASEAWGDGVDIRAWAQQAPIDIEKSLLRIPVGSKRSGVFKVSPEIREVYIPEIVEEICDWAFYGCRNLRRIFIPKSVKRIGTSAFSACTELESVVFEEDGNLIEIGKNAFAYCIRLNRLSFPPSLAKIGERAFVNCFDLTEVALPAGVSEIGYGAFEDCRCLRSIHLPEGITQIENDVFSNCINLQRMNMENIKRIGSFAFYNCKRLSGFYFSNCLEEIGDHTFQGCNRLTKLELSANVKRIGEAAFKSCTRLQHIQITDATTIGQEAFLNCTGLESVVIEGTDAWKPLQLGPWAFAGCSHLENVEFQNSWIKRIEEGTFWGCRSLEYIDLPYGLRCIGKMAFSRCSSLQEIDLPKSVELVQKFAFEDCAELTSVIIEKTFLDALVIEEWAFRNCMKLQEVLMGKKVYGYIEACAFEMCPELMEIAIPTGISISSPSAFHPNTTMEYIVPQDVSASYLISDRDEIIDALADSRRVQLIPSSAATTCIDCALQDLQRDVYKHF